MPSPMITMMSGLPAAKPGAAEKAIEALFKAAVDHYLVACTKPGDKPNKPDSGKLTLRISPSVHADVATAAEISGKSLNKWVADVLNQATQTP